MAFQLTSDAFASGEPIPPRYTCDAEGVSPRLHWSGEPDGTRSYALIVDDPDAPRGVFTHWVVYNIPRGTGNLDDGVPMTELLYNGAAQGRNDFGKIGYGGPCPPPGPPHHYRFTIYALDTTLDLEPGASKQEVLDAMQGHVLGQAQLVGTYQRAGR